MEQVAVRRATIDARRVFNLTAPRWLPEVAVAWAGRRPWHSPEYEAVRDLVEAVYVDRFNRESGHYARLEESIRRDGIWNPVMLHTGPGRRDRELPPAVRADPRRVVCEYVGGSRLFVAQRLGLQVPAIINDRANVFPNAERIPKGFDLKTLFKDKPRRVRWNPDGSVFANFFAYGHLPETERAMREATQRSFRKHVVRACVNTVEKWRRENES